MKKLFFSIAATFALSFTAFGASQTQLLKGSLQVSEEALPADPFCSHASTLVLDSGSIVGDFAYLTNFIAVLCEIRVIPNPRLFKISKIEETGCGSRKYTGSAVLEDGLNTIEIIDHRTRECDDFKANLVQLTVSTNDGIKYQLKTFRPELKD